ncbi:MAG: FAD/NAD(P)-binding protein [Acidobacteriota bacterium]
MKKTLLVVGGASAAIHLLARLAERARTNRRVNFENIVVIDKAVHPEGGSPHSDPSPSLRVNMRTELHDIPGQLPFREFLSRYGGAEADPPLRADLGRYGAHVKAEAVRQLTEAGVEVTFRREEVTRLDGNLVDGFVAGCCTGRKIRGSAAILASGNPPPQLPRNVQVELSGAWRVSCYNGSTEFARWIRPHEPVVVVGTGPSGIDIARHLIEVERHEAPIYLISRTGKLSAVQLASPAPPELEEELRDVLAYLRRGRITRLDLLRQCFSPVVCAFDPDFDLAALAITPPDAVADLAVKIEKAAQNEPRWRQAVDAFGLLAPEIWRALDEYAKLEFAKDRSLVRAYYTNRHAMQPATARWVLEAMKAGQVRVGSVGEGVIRVNDRGVTGSLTLLPGGPVDIRAGHLVVATGPQYELSKSSNPLIRQLLDEGRAKAYQIGDLEIGGFLTQGLELAGMPGVYAMGALVRGEDYAVHSFPALRRHARIIADALSR